MIALPLWVYALVACAAAILGLGALHAYDLHKIGALKSAQEACFLANQSNQESIATLTAANKKWQYQATISLSHADEAEKSQKEAQDRFNQSGATANKNLQVIYAKHPDVKAWADSAVDLSVASELHANSGKN